jgi:hypothetical protein
VLEDDVAQRQPLARAVRMKLEFMVSIMLPRMMREMAEM